MSIPVEIATEVAAEAGVTVKEIFSKRQFRKVCWARWEVWRRLRARRWSTTKIAAAFRMDHSTVLHGLKKIDAPRLDPPLQDAVTAPRPAEPKRAGPTVRRQMRMIAEYWKAQGVEVEVAFTDGRIVSKGIPVRASP